MVSQLAALRKIRMDMFRAFRASEKPVQVVFQGGRTETIPDLSPMLRPTRVGDAATYFFFGLGGLFVGGETGFLTGGYSAVRTQGKDHDRFERIQEAYRRFRADALRVEADKLDRQGEETSVWRW